MNKKVISLLLTAIMIITGVPFSLITAFAEETMTPIVKAADEVAFKGSTVDVDIVVKNNPGFSGAKITLTYSPLLTLVNATTGNAFDCLDYTKPGLFKSPCNFTWDSENSTATEDGTLLTLTFKVSDEASENEILPVNISIKHGDFYNSDLEDVDFTTKNGTVKVISYVPGDVNSDNEINGKDVTLVRRYNAGGYNVTINTDAADVNDDNSINGKDITLIRRYNAGGYGVILLAHTQRSQHILSKVEAKPATCVVDGNVEYWYCSECDKYYYDENENEEITDIDDTVVKAKGHTVVIDEAIPATETSTGLTEGSHCSVCNAVLVAQEEIPMLKGEQYSITYNIANGDAYLASQNIENTNPEFYLTSTGLTLKNVSVPGYNFLGWYDLPAGSGATIVKKILNGENGDIELYAHWEKIEYTIQFESDLIPVNSVTYTIDKGVALPIPQLEGYNFVGWSNNEGEIIKTVPKGTIGNKVFSANWLSERNKAWTKKNLDSPIIVEDDETNTILFTYEIGKIENVPLFVVEDFGYINSEGVSRTVSKEYTVKTSEALMEQYTKNVANSTTNSSQWSLSSGWTDTLTVNENFLIENNISDTDAKTICTTDGTNWLISSGTSGSSTTTTYNSSQDYDLTTSTDNTKTYDVTETNDSFSHKYVSTLENTTNKTKELGATIGGNGGVNIGYGSTSSNEKTSNSSTSGIGININTAINSNNTSSATTHSIQGFEDNVLNTEASKTGTENENVTETQTGSIKHTGSDTVSSGGWNNSSSYGGSKSISESNSVSQTISEKVASEYGYGKSYIKNGEEASSQGTSSSNSTSDTYSSAVTYSTENTTTETISYTTSNTKTGYHRLVKAGTAHVFAIVGYDIKNASYFVSTYTVMDDEIHTFEDYSYSTAAYDDNQTGVISFEVPFEVEKYVLSKVGETVGLEINSEGIITGYFGTEKTVFIPEYRVIDNRDGTKKVIKTTGISSNAFRGNTNITGVELSEYISDIPDNAFNGCVSLQIIKMAGVTTIGNNAFKNTELDFIYLSNKIISIGTNAFENVDVFAAYAANYIVVDGVVNSGAKNILLYISEECTDLNSKSITVSSTTDAFIFYGCGKTFNDVSISSEALYTEINNATFISSSLPSLIIASENAQLGQANVNALGFGLVLTNDCELGLYGESFVSSESGKAILCKNLLLNKTDDATEKGVYSELEVDGNIYVYGDITGQSYINTGDNITKIDENAYQKYLKGMYTVSFNANGGSVLTTLKTIYNGQTYGALPTPTRQYYTFDGWYTAASGGTKVTSSTTVDTIADITLYAHWTRDSFVVTFDANGGNVSTSTIRGYCGQNLGTLPTPTRDYYDFNGWFTAASGGTKVTSTTQYTTANDITVYAHWTQHSPSDWVRRSDMPSGAQIVSQKWSYTQRSYTESSSSLLEGWNKYDTQRTGWSGWSDWLTWNPDNGVRNVQYEAHYDHTEYHYYRYTNSSHTGVYTYPTGKYTILEDNWFSYVLPNSSGYSNIGYYGTDNWANRWVRVDYAGNNSGVSNWTRDIYRDEWRYQDPIYTYYYYQDNAKESTSYPSGSDISNIVEWVRYRAK